MKYIIVAAVCVFAYATSAHALSSGPDAGGYYMVDSNEVNGPTYAYEDLSIIPNAGFYNGSDDGATVPIPLGFTFNYYGVDYTTVSVCTNGFLNFDATLTSTSLNTENSTGVALPIVLPFDPADPYAVSASLPTAYIALNFVDQDPYTDGNTIYIETLGVAPNRRFVVQYKVPHFVFTSALGINDLYDYEVTLYEGSNDIVFQYKKIDNVSGWTYSAYTTEGAAATVGIQGSATAGTNYQSGSSNIRETGVVANLVGASSGALTNNLAVRFTLAEPTSASIADALDKLDTQKFSGEEAAGGCMSSALSPYTAMMVLMFFAGLFAFGRRRNS